VSRYPLVDLAAVHRELGDELERAVLDVVRSQNFIGGPRIAAFEAAFAGYLGVAEVVGVANGTDALELALRALEIEPGAEVLVPANTFIATAEAVVAAGAVPRFVDVDGDSGLLDLRSCEDQVNARTRAVIPVHLYGRMAEMDAVLSFAQRHALAVIEDAAQAHGAQRAGRRAGTIGHAGCFSFYPGKNLGAFGDAGAVVTNDPTVAERLRLLRDHGRRGRNHHAVVGMNSRLDPLHATVLAAKLPHLDRWNEQRRTAAGWYRDALPEELLDWRSDDPLADVHHLFPIITAERDAVAQRLAQAGVQTGVHYSELIPRTPAFSDGSAAFSDGGGTFSDGDTPSDAGDAFPAAARRARSQLSLPMHPHLTREDTEFIASVVGSAILAEMA
jgi:dTDP-4-amino-4,6-dideoxygalactose transaminase